MPNTLRALIFFTIILLLAGSFVLFRAKYATAPAPAPQSTGTLEQWATFEHDFFPWVVRYPASWYVQYSLIPLVSLKLYNFDYRSSGRPLSIDDASINFFANSISQTIKDTEAEALASAPNSELTIAGLPAKEWVLGSPPDLVEARVYIDNCYYKILLSWNQKNIVTAQKVREDFDKILKELQPKNTPLTC